MKKNIRHFFLLTGLATGCIYGINKFIETTSNMKSLLQTKKGHYFEWRYGNIFYTKHGKGSPILLIHDLHPASSSIEWQCLIKHLEKEHTVYAIDLLGCGRSEKPNLTYTNYMYVQLITDFVKKIIEQKTDVIATGASCSFSLMAANMDDNIFNKLFFINVSPLELLQSNPNKQSNLLKKLFDLPILGTFFYNIQMRKEKITDLLGKKVSAKLKDYYYESAHLKQSKGKFLYGSILGKYTNINIIPALKKVENPIFLIGARDVEESIKTTESYLKYDELIETAYISGCNKLPQFEQPEKLFEAIQMFYEDAQ